MKELRERLGDVLWTILVIATAVIVIRWIAPALIIYGARLAV